MMQVGLDDEDCLIPINSRELDNREGLLNAIDFVKNNRIHTCASIIAHKGNAKDKDESAQHAKDLEGWYYQVHGCKPQDVPDDLSYEAFQSAGLDKKYEISTRLLLKKLEAMENDPDLLAHLQEQRKPYLKFHIGRNICKPLDVTRNVLNKLACDWYAAPIKTTSLKLVAPAGAMYAVCELCPQAILLLVPESAVYAATGSFAALAIMTVISPLASGARRLLTRYPPAIRKQERVAQAIESAVENHLSERVQDIVSTNAPIVQVGAHRCYFEPVDVPINNKFDRLIDVAGGSSNPMGDAVWIQQGTAKLPTILIEELEHRANDLVGFDEKKWSEAVVADIKLPGAKSFIKSISAKWAHLLVYPKDVIGSETLEEIGVYYDRERKAGRTHEEIMTNIDSALPNTGKLFREYKADEAKFFKRIADEVEFDEGMDKIRAEGLKPTAEKFAAKLHKGYVADLEKPSDGQISAPSL